MQKTVELLEDLAEVRVCLAAGWIGVLDLSSGFACGRGAHPVGWARVQGLCLRAGPGWLGIHPASGSDEGGAEESRCLRRGGRLAVG